MKQPQFHQKSRKEAYLEEYNASKKGGEWFFPQVIFRDAIIAALLVALIIVIAIVIPATSEPPADPTSTNYNPRPEWYFLFFFEFLKLFPGRLEPLAATIIPLIAIIILILVPFVDRSPERNWSKRKIPIGAGFLVLAALITLEVTGTLSAPARPAGQTNPVVQKGQQIYTERNCAYCHSIRGVGGAVGPDLSGIGSQLTADQLMLYLENPNAMIPQTLHPKLLFTEEELQALVAYLATQGATVNYTAEAPQLFDKYCSPCHMINGKGGTAGPDLSGVGSRRSIEFLEAFITDPKSVIAGTTMPAFKNTLTTAETNDIAAYLYSLKEASPLTVPSTPPPATPPTETQLYAADCASCHGDNRQGGIGPALTTSALAGQTVSRIESEIAVGSDGMPGFSARFTPAQVSALAGYLKNTPP